VHQKKTLKPGTNVMTKTTHSAGWARLWARRFPVLLGLALLSWSSGATLQAATRQGALFSGKETFLSLFGTYAQHQDTLYGGGYALNYFASQYIGIGTWSYWDDWDGAVYDNLAADLTLRLPIPSLHVAPYAIGSVGYDFDESEFFEGFGGGLELRFQPSWGLYGDYQYLFREDNEEGGFIRFGLRLKF